jgi:ATP-dependent RNA helicase DeaD
LAIQVAESFSTYGAHTCGLNVATIYGGQDYEPQLRQLRRGAQVVVGTPGRVIDHIKRGTLDLCSIQCLILDEADEMLNMGFLEDVQFVLEQSPDDRQIALFSATLPEPIRKIAQNYLNDPVKITIKKKTMTADSIRQRALFVAPRDKIEVLKRILEAEESEGVIVFTKTKDATVTVAEKLARDGLSAVALNGDMPQKVRERTIDQLKSGRLDILVATDVAARGLDVSRVSHVFNFDLPHDTESYIHRVGRTGRAGRKGEAIIFLTNAQRHKLRVIERVTKQPIEVVQPPTADEINANRVAQFKQSITNVTAARDLTMFKELIAEYAAETDKPIELIAAALAHLGQNGRPFLMKDRRQGVNDRGDRRNNDRGDNRREQRDEQRHDRDGGQRRGTGGYSRQLGAPEAGMIRYRIEVGRKDGVKPGNIVGAVANEAGIDGEFIGPIKIHDGYSTVDLPEGMPQDIHQSLSNTRVAGKKLMIKADTETDRRPSRRRDRDNDKSRKQSHGKKHRLVHASSRAKPAKPGKPGKRKKRKTKSI